MKHLRFIVNQENKLFRKEISESIMAAGETVIGELRAVQKFKQLNVVANSRILSGLADMMNKGIIKPYYFFKQIGGVMQKLYKNVRDGEDTYINHIQKAKDFAQDVMARHNYREWSGENDVAAEFKTSQNKTINLTTGDKLYIYMAYKRDQGKAHILGGGIVPEKSDVVSKKLSKGLKLKYAEERADAIKFSEVDVLRLTKTLTQEQIGFADEMGEYLSTVCADMGNEVSLKLFGYEKFLEKNYIPINSASNFLFTKAGVTDDKRIKRAGFTKSLTPKANNPIIAADFMDVWAKHVNDMAMYNSFVLPIEDFTRVWNYKQTTPKGINAPAPESVKTTLQNAYGRNANDYIKKLMNDINGGIKPDSSTGLTNKLISLMKRSAVMANLSVAIQQPTTLIRAFAVVDPKYFVKSAFTKKSYKELMQYSPQAVLKKYGYFDTNMGRNITDILVEPEYDTPLDKIKAFFKDKSVRDDVFSWLPQKADELAWSQIWNAVKAETLAETNIQEGTAEFYEKCKERFKEVVDRSQVMDSVFQRPEMMRSQDTGVKMATAFMAEPLVNYNMLRDAMLEHQKGNKAYAGRIVAAVTGTMILNSVMKAIIGAIRDGEEDKKFSEKYSDALIGNLIDGPLSMVPYVNTVYSIFQGYNANRPDMQLFQDLYYAFARLDSDKYTTFQKTRKMAEALAAFTGTPLKNITRDIETVWRNTVDMLESTGAEEGMSDYEKAKVKYDITNLDSTAASGAYYDLLFQAQQDADSALYKQIYDDLLKSGRKPSNIENAMASRRKEKLFNRKKDEEYTDPIVADAVDAYDKGDTVAYRKARMALLNKGHELKDIDSAINSLKAERAKENAPTTDEWIRAYKTGKKDIWQPIFKKMRAAGWSQEDLLHLVK